MQSQVRYTCAKAHFAIVALSARDSAARRTQFEELIPRWAPLEPGDALELLSKDYAGWRAVREYAVARLDECSSADLLLYLPQLVQAMRFEPREDGPLQHFLLTRACDDVESAAALYWHLTSEIYPKGLTVAALAAPGAEDAPAVVTQGKEPLLRCREQLLQRLDEERNAKLKESIEQQKELRRVLMGAVTAVKAAGRRGHEARQALLRQHLAALEGKDKTYPLPYEPTLRLTRLLTEHCEVMRSSMYPAKIVAEVRHSTASESTKSAMMFKSGDDLRQDQLCMQLLELMDSLFTRYGLDMRMKRYRVIAFSSIDGMVQFVPDTAELSSLLKETKGDLLKWFRDAHPAADAPLGVRPEVLDNFIRSCAGYSVATYILGVGDRHLDNLLLHKPTGALLHIDYGWIFGKDPKPLPPPMKLCKEMIDAMGGMESNGYHRFRDLCCQCYKILRRNSSVLVNLLSLMAESGLKDMEGNGEFAILKVQQKLQLSLSEAAAEDHFMSLIDDSVSALFPLVMEQLHRWALYWK